MKQLEFRDYIWWILDGAKAKKVVNLEVLKSISDNTNWTIDFGGGVQSTEDLKAVFEAGAKSNYWRKYCGPKMKVCLRNG